MRKRRTGWIIFVFLVAAAAGGLWFWRSRTPENHLDQYQTATVERGTLTATVGSTGTVRSNQSTILTWQTTGTIGKIYVKVGDKVQTGKILAELSRTSLPQSIILAQVDLATAQRNLDDLLNSNTARAQAQLNVVTAQKNRDSANSTLNSMLAKNRGGTSADILNAQAKLVLAEDALDQAQSIYDMLKDRPDTDTAKAQAYTNLYNAQQAYRRAQDNLNFFLHVPSGRDVDEARAKLALAEAQLADAQREWERLKNGPDPNDVAVLQARIDAAQAILNMAQISAPFTGTVTAVSGMVGDQVSPGTRAFRIDDLSRLLIEAQVGEVDINNVRVGQAVIITFDAIPAQEYHGRVVEVGWTGETIQGIVNFPVTIELEDADAQVKPGMTAAVTIMVKKLDNVILVQNRAVRVVNGQRVVYVLRNGTIATVNITLGATSDTVSEVIAGDLQVGDQVILNPPTTFGPSGNGHSIFGGGNR